MKSLVAIFFFFLAAPVSASVPEQNCLRYVILANYSPLDLFVPNKYGVSAGIIQDQNTTWELEYLHGKFSFPFFLKNLGTMSDDRVSLMRRSSFGKSSFNVSYGLSYFSFSAHLGSALLESVSGSFSSVDLVRVQSLGLNLGIGNRWTFSHRFTLGVDWLSWSQPVMLIDRSSDFLDASNSKKDKDRVSSVIRSLSHLPRFSLLKLQFGMSF